MIRRRQLAQIALFEDLCPICSREILQLEHMVLRTALRRDDAGELVVGRREAWAHEECIERVVDADGRDRGELRLEASAPAFRRGGR